jgi:hypothetical protein
MLARQFDADGKSSERGGCRLQAAVVCLDDEAHDRKSQACAARRGSYSPTAAERFEQRVDISSRDHGSAIGDVQPHPLGRFTGRDPQPSTGDVVPDRVLNQVAYQPFEKPRIAEGPSGFDLTVDRDVLLLGLGFDGVEYRGDQLAQIDRLDDLELTAAHRLQPGQRQQRRHEALGALGGVLDNLAHSSQLSGVGVRICQGYFQLGSDDGQRRSKLMTGVGDE